MAKTRIRRPRSEWVRLVAEWRGSGLSGREFAEQRGVAASTLVSWARRLREEANEVGERHQATALAPVVPTKPAFTEVRVRSGAPRTTAGRIEVITPNGYMIRVSGDVDRGALAAVVEVVDRC